MSSNARKELRNLLRAIEDYHENAIEYVGKTITDVLGQHINAAYEALGEPLRNCDVGSPEEQNLRHGEWCRKYGIDGSMDVPCGSPDWCCHLCFARWAQMPYKKEGEE